MQGLSCEQLRSAMAQGRALTAEEWAHVEVCETCLDTWVCYGLESKPEVRIPADFAARVVAALPEKRDAEKELGGREHSWVRTYVRGLNRYRGLMTAIVLVAAGLIAMQLADPTMLNTRMGLVFVGIVASEIGGIALWLGTRTLGEH